MALVEIQSKHVVLQTLIGTLVPLWSIQMNIENLFFLLFSFNNML